MRRLILAAGAVLLTAAQAQTPTLPLRIAEIGAPAAPCAPLGADSPAGQRAYFSLLAERLQTDVLNCPMADAAAAAQALAAGEVDIAKLDGEAFGPVSGTVRSVLTTRARGALNRLPVVVATLDTAPAQSLTDLAGASLVFGGPMKASLEVPKAVLADYGADDGYFGAQAVAEDYEKAAERLRAGQAQAMVLHAGAWQKLCRGDQPGLDLCKDLRVVWRQRGVADEGWAVRTDMSDDRRFRLIGIHVAMHNEAPDAFAWAAGPAAEEFEPTEAKAPIHQGPTVGS
ncbi:PhnD/SsuA/transferrin family substrate-binding protein [Phenylobacterium sp.]|uniref:PhnD/SsuA/transferrin family substrate-binding protein n=1 Tax=Phenylobacterium sp. TaxID=1871053 RepID=UPI00272F484A|nr:PhnD/SsuA/transferrin family substrate-binding protein [Phenylobacterium sp.]MDP1618590.1 PhnD/SsuA/transferrin family substrate-binding protein [Phenylobacterium sp.]MDP1989155.1 PhnD/SsuA/transferrin family substrate-binding protein [Phenylobacterium sp.]